MCVASSVRNSSSGQSSLQICVGIPTVDGVAKTVNIQVALFAWKNILEQRSQSAQKHTGQMVSGGARDASFRHVTFVRELHGPNKRSTKSRSWRSGRAHGASKLGRLRLRGRVTSRSRLAIQILSHVHIAKSKSRQKRSVRRMKKRVPDLSSL